MSKKLFALLSVLMVASMLLAACGTPATPCCSRRDPGSCEDRSPCCDRSTHRGASYDGSARPN
jgi:hypothetical protein